MDKLMNDPLESKKRILATCVAVMLWWLSMTFSVRGFGSIGETAKEDAWIGWTLAFAVTAYELIWNGMKERTNLTMFVVGCLAYSYGIISNIAGIASWMGLASLFDGATFQSVLTWIFALLLGLVIEIAPEPSFIWGVTGNYKGGDFLGNLFGNRIPIAPTHKEWGGSQEFHPKPLPFPSVSSKPRNGKGKYIPNFNEVGDDDYRSKEE